MTKYDPEYLNREEKELVEGLKKVDARKVRRPSAKTQRQFRSAARRYMAQEAKMNIRIDPNELGRIKERAERDALLPSPDF